MLYDLIMKIFYLMLLFSNILYAQSLRIQASQINQSSILVTIKNLDAQAVNILLDENHIEYACDYEKQWPALNNFARLAICFDYPQNYKYYASIVPSSRLTEGMYGDNRSLSLQEYIEQNTISLKPEEERKIIYSISDFNNSTVFKKKKKFKIKCKIIYFGKQIQNFINQDQKYNFCNQIICSNYFSLTTNFFRP